MAFYAVRFDQVSSTLSYSGKAAPGSLPSSPVWQIKRVVITGSDIVADFADGDALFDNVWDDRVSLSYP